MNKEDLKSCFQDTIAFSKSEKLKIATEEAIQSSKIYKEGFTSQKTKYSSKCYIEVKTTTTFEEAKKNISSGKVAVLNFANPEIPGGGVQNGAMAQEECLCRSSNLYLCIADAKVQKDYYQYHISLHNRFYSDRLIYTKSVTVFKDDSTVPQMMSENEWFNVDVITCAAPYITKRKYTNLTALKLLFKSRIKNIFETAIDNDVEILILGAFGCGAFKNPPKIVAEAFQEVIYENDYKYCFKKIIFAIKPSATNCENVDAFSRQFDVDAPDAMERCCLLTEPSEWRFYRIPQLHNKAALENNDFRNWQGENPYFGKQFSVLGDSISTLEGYIPRGYNVFYTGDNCQKSGIYDMPDTWWGKVIDFFGGELLVNNSWSGSRATRLPNKDIRFPSGCSKERTNGLHINSVKPDVILVYLGTNDWANGVPIDSDETRLLVPVHDTCFSEAYEMMIDELQANYPKAEIWCCTLCSTFISSKPEFSFPYEHGGINIEMYNDVIRSLAKEKQCKLIDFDKYSLPYDSLDGSHPTNDGMNTLAMMAIRTMEEESANRFLDCEKENHDLQLNGQTGSYDFYVCKKCGKEITLCAGDVINNDFQNLSNFSDFDDKSTQEQSTVLKEDDYVMLDQNITRILYSDAIRFTLESTGKTVTIKKSEIKAGRALDCDLRFDSSHTYVARHQATFFYEHETWFLMDNQSTNGTWLNDVKIEPGKKYELAANDEIDFARSEKVIFEKHDSNNNSLGNEDEKALAFLEVGIDSFVKSDYKDEIAFKLIASSLIKAPLFFPVEIDIEAMLGDIDPTKLKKGDTIQPNKDVRMRILTISLDDSTEVVPMFTSSKEAHKGPSASTIRYYPQDYIPMLAKMNKIAVINPFSNAKFVVNTELISDILLPAIEKKAESADKSDNSAQHENLIGTVVEGKYRIIKEIGRGGLSRIYLASDERINKVWAIKSYDKQDKRYSSVAYDAIMQEAHMMMKLQHLGIPQIVDVIENERYLFIVREYIEGETLENIVKNYGSQPPEMVIDWAKQLCDVLYYLHTLRPPHIYRDMKPANVILQPSGTVKIIDFGIMRTYKEGQISDTASLGTKGYAAPEQYGTRQTDARTDIYALGMTMYQLLTGLDPKEINFVVQPLCQVNSSLPKGLEYIIDKCIKLNPDERYQTCMELRNDLNNYLQLPPKKGIFAKLFGSK